MKNKLNRFLVVSILVFVLAISSAFTASIWRIDKVYISFANSDIFIAEDGDLVVHFINMGQADAIVVQFPSGEVMMIDSGISMPSNDNAHVTAERNKLRDYLNTYVFGGHVGPGKPLIDWFVLTHSDYDHVGGVPMLYTNYDIGVIYRPAIFTTAERDLLNSSKETAGVHGIGNAELYGKKFGAGPWTVATGATYASFVTGAYTGGRDVIFHEDAGGFDVGDVEVTFHAPEKYHYGGSDSSAHNINSQCPLIVLDYEGRRILLTGDATEEQNEEWLDNHPTPQPMDIMKIQHHGSLDGNSVAFLENVLCSESYAIISVGDKSVEGSYSWQYDHPKQTVLNRLNAILDSEDQIFMTFEVGDVLGVISLDGYIDIILDHHGKPSHGDSSPGIPDPGTTEKEGGQQDPPEDPDKEKPWEYIIPLIIVSIIATAATGTVCILVIKRRHKKDK